MPNTTAKIAICLTLLVSGSPAVAGVLDLGLLADGDSIRLVQPIDISDATPLPTAAELEAAAQQDKSAIESVPEPSGLGLLLLAGLGGAIIAVRARLG